LIKINKGYRPTSWVDPRVEVRLSPTHGKGMFAITPIKSGEIVLIWGGTLMTEEDIHAGKAKKGSIAAIDEGHYLVSLKDGEDDPADFMNHSCDSNIWMEDEVTLVARRNIEAGEELTADYAMWEANEEWVGPWECRCGSTLCRKTYTAKDWRRKELQERYRNHFSPFINERIRKLNRESNRSRGRTAL
jgi:hypothetical protein